MTNKIPGPRGLPFVGNVFDLKHEEGLLAGMEHLADVYGDVYSLNIGGKNTLVASSAEALIELSDEKTFLKVPPQIVYLGDGAQGLFTAASDDPDWGQGHRILAPAFGPLAVEQMFEGTV